MAEGKSKAQQTWVHHPYDKSSRYAVAVHPQGLLDWLDPSLRLYFRFIRWAPVRGQIDPDAADRVGDTVAQLLDLHDPNQPVAIPIEIQTVAESLTIFRLLRYTAIFSHLLKGENHRPCDIYAAVIHLTGDVEVKHINSLRPNLAGGLNFKIISKAMRDEDAATLLDQIEREEVHWCMLYWVSLMQGGERLDIIIRWKALAKRFIVGEEHRNLGVVVLTFAELTGRLEIWREQLKEWRVIESQLLKEWTLEAEFRGKLAGIVQGKAEGKTEGKAEGKAEGQTEGKLLMGRSNLMIVLEQKFASPVPTDIDAAIAAQDDPVILSRWLKESINAASLGDVRKCMGLPKPQPASKPKTQPKSSSQGKNGSTKPPKPTAE